MKQLWRKLKGRKWDEKSSITITQIMLPHSQPLSIHQKMNFINTNVVSIVESFGQVRGQVGLEVLRGSSALCKRKEYSHEFHSVSDNHPSFKIVTSILVIGMQAQSPLVIDSFLHDPQMSFLAPEAMQGKATLLELFENRLHTICISRPQILW